MRRGEARDRPLSGLNTGFQLSQTSAYTVSDFMAGAVGKEGDGEGVGGETKEARERQTERDWQRDRHRETDRRKETGRETDSERQTERDWQRDTKRDRQRETDSERETDGERGSRQKEC